MVSFTEIENSSLGTPAENALTVDVEDYFQVSAFEPYVKRDNWSTHASRVERNIARLLELFEAAGATGTFFFLGWVAEKYPALLREVAGLGHEIASHGYAHIQVTAQNQAEFAHDVERTKKLLEDLAGMPIVGYRAASFSIAADNPWAHDVLATTGHEYSSSYYPIRHDRYGMRDMLRFPMRDSSSGIVELPVTTVELAGMRFPCGGGGYFRLLPYAWTKWGIRRVNRIDRQPAMFYFHPWEIDPEQPRFTGLDTLTHFRHYYNLRRTESKLRRLLHDFRWRTIRDVYGDLFASSPV